MSTTVFLYGRDDKVWCNCPYLLHERHYIINIMTYKQLCLESVFEQMERIQKRDHLVHIVALTP